MIKRVINLGVRETTAQQDKIVLQLSNEFCLVEFLVFAIFIGIFFKEFSPILWIPILAALSALGVLVLNAMYLTKLSRIVLVLCPVGSWTLANAYLTPSDGTPIIGLMAFTIIFCFLPFVIFNYKERKYQIWVFICAAAHIVLFPWLNDLFVLDTSYYDLFGQSFEYVSLPFMVVTLFGIGSAQHTSIKTLMQTNNKLIAESEEQKKELHQQQAEIKETLNELETARAEDEKRNWINNGIAEIGQILRAESDYEKLYDQLISKLAHYLKANQGGLFLYNPNENCLELTAMYAYDRKKFLNKKIDIGEGLIGQAFIEKDIIYLTQVPESYVQITSGLGEATPTSLLVAPMLANEKVEAVMELAFFHELEPHELDFIRKLGEEIAVVISSNRLNLSTKELLQQSQQQAEEMKAQEEEMRQNMEELEATQEEMSRAQHELRRKQANLDALINNTEDSIITIDREYKAIIINQKILDRYHGSQYENIGEGFNVLETLGDVRDEWKAYYDRAFAGEKLNFVLKSSVKGEDSWREYFINPMKDDDGVISGVSVLSRDVTDIYLTKTQLEEKEQLLKSVLDSSADTFFAIDRTYKIIVANRTLRNRFKQTGTDLIAGFDILASLEKEQRDYWKPIYDRILNGEHFVFEQKRPVKDKVLHLEVHCTPIKNDKKEVIGASVLSKDITRWQELRLKLEEIE